jgi:hypothetical protein
MATTAGPTQQKLVAVAKTLEPIALTDEPITTRSLVLIYILQGADEAEL